MKNTFQLQIVFLLLLALLICCAHSQYMKKKEMTIKIEIVKGETTETSVLRLLGVPSSTSTDNIGNEVWQYIKLVYATSNGEYEHSVTFWEISTGMPDETSEPFDLKIVFDHNDIVKDYELVH
jgi:hypothetical protein